MLLELVTLFLGGSLLLYCLLGGADFGAGMLEAFLGQKRREEQREIIIRAMGPVWEANHMWLILAVVILWNGFPKAFRQLCTTFHIPLTLMLLGVVLRGSSFAFRHYDAVRDRAQRHYTAVFVGSSFLAPLMLGMVAGGLLLGRVDLRATDFFTGYVAPWLNLFCIALGGFLCALFAFLAAVYLIGETQDAELRLLFARRARLANAAAVFFGALSFLSAEVEGLPLVSRFLAEKGSLLCLGLATLLLIPLWRGPLRPGWTSQRTFTSRLVAGVQVALVLLGWYMLQAPVLIAAHAGSLPASITLQAAAAPDVTLRFLLGALLVGSLLIFPALIYLLRVFKTDAS
jgi:cytochrome d ubiquinol oxidase subunit II